MEMEAHIDLTKNNGIIGNNVKTRTLNPNNYEDMLIIDNFNKKLYNKYKSSGGQLKNDKLNELVLDPDTGRVYVKDLTVYDDDGNKILRVDYTYSISSRKTNNGEYKNYIVRHKNKYVYGKKPTNKFEYLLKISNGTEESSEHENNIKFVIPDLKLNNNVPKPLYEYLSNVDDDVDKKIKIKNIVNDIMKNYGSSLVSNSSSNNCETNKKFDLYGKSAELSNILNSIHKIPIEFRFNYKQIVNWLYRIHH